MADILIFIVLIKPWSNCEESHRFCDREWSTTTSYHNKCLFVKPGKWGVSISWYSYVLLLVAFRINIAWIFNDTFAMLQRNLNNLCGLKLYSCFIKMALVFVLFQMKTLNTWKVFLLHQSWIGRWDQGTTQDKYIEKVGHRMHSHDFILYDLYPCFWIRYCDINSLKFVRKT